MTIPLSIYIHFPWCARKCPYCDFNSHATNGDIPESATVSQLLNNLDGQLRWIQERSVQSIFIGGGTPSLISGSAINRLLNGIRKRVTLAGNAEITIEANPGTLDQRNMDHWYGAGINRLSIGVQSFQDAFLQRLGRIHTAADAVRMVEAAQTCGFENINLDLMFGLPNQQTSHALADLQKAIDLHPTHLSWYQLTIEPNTLFYNKPPKLPQDERVWEMQGSGQALLKSAGYHQYEVSAWSLADKQCLHNLNYWEFGDYLGLGAGAHGKVTLPDSQILRTRYPKMPNTWLAHEKPPETSLLSQHDKLSEFLINALRLRSGFTPALFVERTGLAHCALEEWLKKCEGKNLLDMGKTIRANHRGFDHLNELLLLAL
ncbi:MAG: radical SAM family heme chaperone HemW [Gammaproteobacteria bacterium]|nr:radical SAM family heme chaperone HemW [Gammaproteobacteria bacterium]